MVTTLALLTVLTCRMPAPPPVNPVVTRCEGADRVTRVHGEERRREVNACTVVRCEGSDVVRRTYAGMEIDRDARRCGSTEPLTLRYGLSAR